MKKQHKNAFRCSKDLTLEHLNEDPKMAKEFLKIAFENYRDNKDEKELLVALKYLTIANGGFGQLSTETGLSRESLYKTLSKNGNPRLNTLKTILENLGYSLYFRPLAKHV